MGQVGAGKLAAPGVCGVVRWLVVDGVHCRGVALASRGIGCHWDRTDWVIVAQHAGSPGGALELQVEWLTHTTHGRKGTQDAITASYSG